MFGLFIGFDLMIPETYCTATVIFIGCALMMAYLPNPYPFEINVERGLFACIGFFRHRFLVFGNSIKVKRISIQFTSKK